MQCALHPSHQFGPLKLESSGKEVHGSVQPQEDATLYQLSRLPTWLRTVGGLEFMTAPEQEAPSKGTWRHFMGMSAANTNPISALLEASAVWTSTTYLTKLYSQLIFLLKSRSRFALETGSM